MLPLILATIVRIVDGDTLRLVDEGRELKVRLLGIDCPESSRNAKCRRGGEAACREEVKRGKAAKARAQDLVPERSTVTFEAHGTDRYRRTLAYVFLPDGRDLGLTLLKEGVCADWSKKYPHQRSIAYQAAAKSGGQPSGNHPTP